MRNGRDWALGLAPQELADRKEGLVFAGMCLAALVMIAASDLLEPKQGTVGSIALIPVAAAAWLLSSRLTVIVVLAAMVLGAAPAMLGAVHPITAATVVLMVPVLAILARLAATRIVDNLAQEEAARRARAAAEQARELESAKSQFLRVASHELRGPLAILRGYIDMMSDGSLGEMAPLTMEVLPRLAATASGMNATVDQLLDAARLEDSRLQLQRQRCDLAAITGAVVATMRILHGGSHDIRFRSSCDPMPLEVDEARIATVIGNLLSNAMKYSPAGAPVTVALDRVGDRALVCVTDEGVGVEDKDLGTLFTRFGRIQNSSNGGVPGTGLGLFLSRELARLHGGDITVHSRAGQGSTFTLSLPAPRPAVAAPIPAAAPMAERPRRQPSAGAEAPGASSGP